MRLAPSGLRPLYPITLDRGRRPSGKGHLFAHSDGFFVTITDFGQYKPSKPLGIIVGFIPVQGPESRLLTTIFMIKLQDIDKYVDSRFQRTFVLKGINLDVKQGEFLTIMGPSGAGKSTLMNIIGMLDEPSAGEYYFFDEPVHKMKEKQKSDMHKNYIGFIFQAYHLIDELTVYENIETPLLYKGVSSTQRKSMVAEMLDRFNMVAKKDLFPEQLSGGQQQLVGIARAIVGQPKLLLADEPTGNLHSDQGKQIMEIFKKLNDEGITIIQVTHSEENARMGKRIIRVADGAVVADEQLTVNV